MSGHLGRPSAGDVASVRQYQYDRRESSMVVSGGAVSPENRSNEEPATILDRHRESAPMDVWRDLEFLASSLAAVERERDEAVERAEQKRGGQLGYFAAAAQAIEERDAALARIAAVEATLAELVRLKDGPRDDAYRAAKETAWSAARAVLAASPTPTTEQDATK